MCGKTARNTLNQYTKKTKTKTCRMDLIYKGDSQSYSQIQESLIYKGRLI